MRTLRRDSWLWRCLTLGLGGGLFVLSGCDPQIRSTVLGGLETASSGLAQTLITVFFQGLQSSGSASAAGGTGTAVAAQRHRDTSDPSAAKRQLV